MTPNQQISARGATSAPAKDNAENSLMFANFNVTSRWAVLLVVLPVACAAHCLAGSSLSAQEVLRWKFTPGEILRVSFRQTANTETVGVGAPTSIAIMMEMEMTWRIEAVTEAGIATMSQSFDRLAMSMKTGDVASVDYDSATEPTSSPAKEIAAAVGPLIGREFKLKMTGRGEILDVEPSAEGEQAVGDQANAGLKAIFSPEGISRVLRQSVVVQLPEQPVAPGDEWKSTSSVESPLGLLEQVSMYTFVGAMDRDGRTLEQIKVESKLTASPDAARAKTSIKSQSQSGELWFDRERGRLASSLITQKLTTERPYRDAKIEVRSTAKLSATFE